MRKPESNSVFLDLPNPFDYIEQVRAALKPGGFFGSILPTTNQVSKLLVALRRQNFAFVDVCEILLRFYKVDAERFRPADRMIAHTGYLIFARPVLVEETAQAAALLRESGLEVEEELPLPADMEIEDLEIEEDQPEVEEAGEE